RSLQPGDQSVIPEREASERARVMLRYVVRRLLWVVVLLAGISILTFLLFYLVPGAPAKQALGRAYPRDARPSAPPHGPGPPAVEAVPDLRARPRPGRRRPPLRGAQLATQPRLLLPQPTARVADDPRPGTGDRLGRAWRRRALAAAWLLHRNPGRPAPTQPLRPRCDGPGTVRGVRAGVPYRPGTCCTSSTSSSAERPRQATCRCPTTRGVGRPPRA